MNRTGLLAVLLLTAALFLIMMLLPDEQAAEPIHTPWSVTLSERGNSQLLGITLDESTLLQAQQQWRASPKITLFMPKESPAKVEAYFERVTLGGIRASIVAEITVPETELTTLIDQGARISTQGDGSRKITLDGTGVGIVEQSIITSLTYLPKANLPSEVIKQRFGTPAETFRIEEDKIEHWVYPEIGLDLVFSEETKEVLQYVPPSRFDRLLAPLQRRTNAAQPLQPPA